MKPIRPLPPRSGRTDMGAHIPYVQVRQHPFCFSFYVVADNKPRLMFRWYTLWPDRHAWQTALRHRDWLDGILENCYQRGLDRGMHPDDRFPEPIIHRDGSRVDSLHLYPFWLKKRGKIWLLACGGWVAHLRLRRTGIELEPQAPIIPESAVADIAGPRLVAQALKVAA